MGIKKENLMLVDYGLRSILIENKYGEKWEMPFDSEKVKDSEALHFLLCYINPGDEYTATFKNKEN